MKDFVIMADANCDLSDEMQAEYGVTIIPGHIMLPDKTEILSANNWDKMDREEFYDKLKKNPDGYSTSPASVQEMANIFEDAVNKGLDIVCISISKALSGTLDFMTQAKDLVLEKHPDANIYLVDSLRFGPGFGLLVVNAALQKKAGKSAMETVAFIEANKQRFHQAGWVDDLSFVAKKGRLTHAKAFFGTMAGIKPIGEIDSTGLTTVIGKAKGAKAAYKVLMKYLEATGENWENQIVFIAQSNRMKQAIEYKAMIEEKFKPKAVLIKDMYPLCGINVGPGLMAAYYMGKPVTEGLVEERKLIEGFLAEK